MQWNDELTPVTCQSDFHTRTKTSRTEKLHKSLPQAYVEINPKDAAKYGGIKDGDEIIVRSRHGEIQCPALVSDNVSAGQVFSESEDHCVHFSVRLTDLSFVLQSPSISALMMPKTLEVGSKLRMN